MIAKTICLAAQPHPCHVLISTIWKKVVQEHSCQNHRLKKVPSCKLSAYSITVRQASNGWCSFSQCSNSTSDKSPIAIHFSLITQPLLICRHYTLQSVYCFYLSQHGLHYLRTSYGSCHGICFCFMLCSSRHLANAFIQSKDSLAVTLF